MHSEPDAAVEVSRIVLAQSLTDRQMEVVGLVAQGFTDTEIGSKLGISPRTVRAHVDAARMKLGLRRRRTFTRLLAAFADARDA